MYFNHWFILHQLILRLTFVSIYSRRWLWRRGAAVTLIYTTTTKTSIRWQLSLAVCCIVFVFCFFITFYLAFSTNRLVLDIEKKKRKIYIYIYINNKINQHTSKSIHIHIHTRPTFPPIPSHMFILMHLPSKSRTQWGGRKGPNNQTTTKW